MVGGNCYYCSKTSEQVELRPYGPNSSLVCFKCAMSTPEKEAETERNYALQLEAALAKSNIIMLSEAGPVPVINKDDLN